MVVSDKYRYVFVELPRTGSTAISRELCENYDGRRILHKHATYEEFLANASDAQREYYAFGGIRNPLDHTVSLYFKLLNDHKHSYSSLRESSLFVRLVYGFRSRQFDFAQAGESVDFSRFFLRFYRWPYDNWSSISHRHLDRVLRFENISDDFAAAVDGFGAQLVRPLPLANPTARRKRHFSDYYDDRARSRARWVFGVYMKKWGYEFPESWEPGGHPSLLNRLTLAILNGFRRVYWRFLRPAVYARKSRDLRAQRNKASHAVESQTDS